MAGIALFAVSCGPAVAPRSLNELEAIAGSERAERAKTAAAEAWSEGMRYLRRAREALADGDVGQSDRFAELGIVHVKIAMATARQVAAAERLEEARAQRHDADLELERVQSALFELERELERERTRAHLEQVVDEIRRRAAADEELREDARDLEERKALTGARLEVARELAGRAAVGLEVLRALAGAGVVIEERLLPTEGSFEACLERLEGGDLAGVQEQAEVAGVETRRLWDELWQQEEQGALEGRLAELERAIAAAGLEARREELGIGVMLGGATKGRLSKQTGKAIEALAAELDELTAAGRVRVIALAVDRAGPDSRGIASKGSDRLAAAAAAALVDGGLAEPAVSHRGCGGATPLDALLGGKTDRVAVLLVPVPGAK